MQHMTDEQLAPLFDRAGISRRLLCPLWCRLLRRLGIPCRSPVTFSFLDHVCVQAGLVVTLMAVAGGTLWWLDLARANVLVLITALLVVQNSILVAVRYRGIRNRLSQLDTTG